MKSSTLTKYGITQISEKDFIVPCPQCKNDRHYLNGHTAVVVSKSGKPCLTCKCVNTSGAFIDNGKWFRECPKCSRVIEHTNKQACLASIRKKQTCKSCKTTSDMPLPDGVWFTWTEGKYGTYCRHCPDCNKVLQGSKSQICKSHLAGKFCKSCAYKHRPPVSEELKKKRSESAFKRWANPTFKLKMSPILSNAAHKRWSNPDYCTNVKFSHLQNRLQRLEEEASIASS
jgi:hypothetical protein